MLDVEPVVHEEQLKLWDWIADYYMCSEGEVMAAALPSHFKLSSETIVVLNEEYGEDFSALGHDEFLVAEALLIKRELKLSEVQQILDSSHVYPVINQLINKKVCYVWEALKDKYAPKKEIFILLNPQYHDEANLEKLLNEDKKLILSTFLFSAIRIFLSINPFSCASVAFDFLSSCDFKTSPSVFARCK